jgi:hypothetical protein
MHACVCMYACMHACMCMYARMHACVCMYVCMFVCMCGFLASDSQLGRKQHLIEQHKEAVPLFIVLRKPMIYTKKLHYKPEHIFMILNCFLKVSVNNNWWQNLYTYKHRERGGKRLQKSLSCFFPKIDQQAKNRSRNSRI